MPAGHLLWQAQVVLDQVVASPTPGDTGTRAAVWVGAGRGVGHTRKSISGRRDWQWAVVPAGNAMGCQHPSCVGQVVLTTKSELLQCIPLLQLVAKKFQL